MDSLGLAQAVEPTGGLDPTQVQRRTVDADALATALDRLLPDPALLAVADGARRKPA